ncbi:Deuterolysin metalloprotease family-domain-containing protein [Dactylonectria macrodidyma]|uniref:Neutral protease 2 n=1 Tax=Dactylonectria macrodidyma TaxID=307937 RepID=A0A9P9E7A0_9HYPO|nr:Deuterolysin metalloprotease family-domain-containing protein [Dactylonectria macrodidyma]
MKFLGCFVFAALAVAVPTLRPRDSMTLDVEIQRLDNSKMKAVVRNFGSSDINILRTGTVLDRAGVEKVQVTSEDGSVRFDGIRVSISHNNLPKKAFVRVPAGGSVENDFDVAEIHDLSNGGYFDIRAVGTFHYARDDSETIAGAIPYRSNHLATFIEGRSASETYTAYRKKRAVKRSKISDCSGDQLTAAENALSGCATRAQAAYEAARNGSDTKMVEYFKNADAATRNTVASTYQKMASECGTTNSGTTGYSCADIEAYCEESGATAYADVNDGITVYCSPYWETPAVSTECHAGDQAGITIHEMSHLYQVKGTDDYDGYGYEFVRGLTAEQNLNHADTYMLFANAIQVGC